MSLDPKGGHVFSRRYGGSGHQSALALALDGGKVVVGGELDDTLDFGVAKTGVTSSRDFSAFVARFTP